MPLKEVLEQNALKINIVVKIGDTYFSRFKIDLGFTIEDRYIVLDKANFNRASVDLRDIKTTIPTDSFTLIDKDEEVTKFLFAQNNKYLESICEIYVGVIDAVFDWSEYELVAKANIKSIERTDNGYRITIRRSVSLLNKPLYAPFSNLINDISETDTSLQLFISSNFPPTGFIKIDDEFIQYTGNDNAGNLTGLMRGQLSSKADTHNKGDDTFSVVKVEDNPITLFLQFMISNGGGGIYDVLPFGLGIDTSLIDVAGIENIRATYFPVETMRFYLFDIKNANDFFEKQISLPTNTRILSSVGKITLVYIDQSTLYERLIDEGTIIGIPNWSTSVDQVVNKIIMKWNYIEGIDSYGVASVFEDATSIGEFGEKSLIYSFQGPRSDINGQRIIDFIGPKLLIRLKNPRSQITAKTFYQNMDLEIGDTVRLNHRFVPGESALGINSDMTILDKSIDHNTGVVTLGLYYTTITAAGIKRFGIIAPYSPITSILSQKTFSVPDGQWFLAGYKISINNEIRTIQNVTGNQISVDTNFSTQLTIGDRIKIVEYDLASDNTKARYAFVSPNTGNFNDGGLPYQIVP